MKKIITKVYKTVIDNKDSLRFEYQDGSRKNYKIIQKDCRITQANKTIIKDKRTYYLIENQKQFYGKISRETNNYSNCIFLCEANFSYALRDELFPENAVFFHTIFAENANFQNIRFPQRADFNNAIFIKSADFRNANFNKDAEFWKTDFIQDAYFSNTNFSLDANFWQANFAKNVNFILTKFEGNADFRDVIFTQNVNFSSAKINDILNFAEVKKIKLDLRFTIVERIEYGYAQFSADNRETFLTLKSVALKQNDQIRALEFHGQEYETHFENLKWKQLDKWILGFEKTVSGFGTNPARAARWFLYLVVFSYFFIFLLAGGGDANMKDFVQFLSPVSYDLDKIFSKEITIGFWGGIFFVLYKVLQLTMIYEIIKSFRKFLRKL